MGLDTVVLVYNIEKHFAIKVPDPEWAKVHRITEIHALVLRHIEPESVSSEKVMSDLKGLIEDATGIPANEIKDTDSVTNDLGLD